jgi:NAD(P)H-dependent flavin oxidoreductase YrpB (nitropropane dioxygenase family)
VTDLQQRLGLDVPVVQAGLGGGLARSELAAAVSAAGGLGTIGILPAPLLAAELRTATERAAGRPVAVNLLMPFVTREHVDVCVRERPAVATLFCGHDPEVVARLRESGVFVLHQVGDAAAARRAVADGADGVIVQGVEAGGHVLATQPLTATLPAVLAAVPGRPVLAAGGMVDASDVRAALEAGAAAVVAGTRFLLSEECQAHPAYKERVLGAPETVLTTLFSLGWRDPHRVVPNAAVRRWCGADGTPRPVARAVVSATLPLARRVPMSAAGRLVARQRVGVPMFSPAAVLRGDDAGLVEVTPLYAGAGAARIERVVPAAEALRLLRP